MSGVVLEGDVYVTLERLAETGFDSNLLRIGQRRGGGYGDLLGPLRLIDECGECLADFRQESHPVFLDELAEKSLTRGRTSEPAAEFGQHRNFLVDTERWRRNHVAECGRVRHGLAESEQHPPRRFDVGLIEELEEGLCVTSRNCCLNHCLIRSVPN